MKPTLLQHKRCLFVALCFLLLTNASQAQDLGAQQDMTIDAKARTAVIESALRALNGNYVFPEVAKQMEQALRGRMQRKEYDAITSARTLANTLTQHLQEVSRDKHLRVNYHFEKQPEFASNEEPEAERARRQAFQRQVNFGFERVERLRGNIGYIDLRGFMDANAGSETVAAAMNFLANTDALIFDLRQNGGGQPEMVALISSYLFDQPTHLNDIYSRPENNTREFWTQAEVPGKKYLGKEVYVLTSRYTFSAGEEFTYNLKNLKRATIIGEVTGGGAHPTRPHRLNEYFTIGVPFARAINPLTKTNWEGTGVQPDIDVPREQAQHVAHIAALKNILTQTAEAQQREQLQSALASAQRELDKMKTPLAAAPSLAPIEGVTLPNTAAAKTLRAFLTAFNTGDLATLRRFHEEHGGNPKNAQEDMDFFLQCGGLKLHSVTSSSAYEIETLVQAQRDHRWFSFGITVATNAPHGIDDIRVRPASAPSDAGKKE